MQEYPRKKNITAIAQMPRAIYVELTDRCNLSCPMCRSADQQGDVLPLGTFREIAETLFPSATFVDLRGWGESTILANVENYLETALNYPVRLKLITNATVRRPSLWQRLTQAGVVIGVSFDAAEPELFRRLRGNARQDLVIANLKTIAEGYATAGHRTQDYLYFCITVSGANLDQLEGIVRIGQTVGIRRFKLEPLWSQPSDPENLIHHGQRTAEALERLAALSSEQDLLIELSASLLRDKVVRQATQKLCIHPWDYLYINSRGRLGFCDHLNGREEFTFGDWNPKAFQEFWNGETMRRLREEHVRKFEHGDDIGVCGDCNWCYSNRYMDLEDWIAPEWVNYRVTAERSVKGH